MRFLVQIAVVFFFVGLAQSFGQNPEWKIFSSSELQGVPYGIAIDHKNNVWVPIRQKGLAMYNGKEWISFNEENSDLPGNNLTGFITVDNVNNIYVSGEDSKGMKFVAKFDGENWMKLPTMDSTHLHPFSLAVDKAGVLWITALSSSILYSYDGFKTVSYNSDTLSRMGHSFIVKADPNGSIWVGGGYFLSNFDGKKWKQYNLGVLPTIITVKDIAIDSNGVKWIAGMDGVVRLKDSIPEIFPTDSYNLPFSEYYYNTIAIDKNNKPWFGGSNKTGLTHQNNGIWEHFNTHNSPLPDENVIQIAIDSSGNKWIVMLSAMFGGVAVYREGGVILSAGDVPASHSNPVFKTIPNPVSGTSLVNYTMPEDGFIEIKVLDIFGQVRLVLVKDFKAAGEYRASFTADNLPNGQYYIKMTNARQTITQAVSVLK